MLKITSLACRQIIKLTLTFPGKCWFTNLSITYILLYFICPFVPEKMKTLFFLIDWVAHLISTFKFYISPYVSMQDQNGLMELTGNGKRRPPTQARSWFRRRDGYMDAALAGTLQNSSNTTWGSYELSAKEPAEWFTSHLSHVFAQRKG